MGHDHGHSAFHGIGSVEARRVQNRRRMVVALVINVAMLVATVVGGVLAGSLALLADGGHLLSDAGAIAIGLMAARLAGLPPTPARTFGLQRSEILAALANGVALAVISALVVIAALGRLSDPPEVAGAGVLVLGVVGLGGNVLATLVLAGGERSDLNLEAVLRHSFGDALSSLGVVFAGVIILATGWDSIDPLVSILIAVLIAASSWRLIKEPIDVLLEAAPPGTDVAEIGRALASVPDVIEVHDLHVWTVTSGFPALSAHIVLKAASDRDRARAGVEHLLGDRFGIHHTTLQVVEAAADAGALLQIDSGPEDP